MLALRLGLKVYSKPIELSRVHSFPTHAPNDSQKTFGQLQGRCFSQEEKKFPPDFQDMKKESSASLNPMNERIKDLMKSKILVPTVHKLLDKPEEERTADDNQFLEAVEQHFKTPLIGGPAHKHFQELLKKEKEKSDETTKLEELD